MSAGFDASSRDSAMRVLRDRGVLSLAPWHQSPVRSLVQQSVTQQGIVMRPQELLRDRDADENDGKMKRARQCQLQRFHFLLHLSVDRGD